MTLKRLISSLIYRLEALIVKITRPAMTSPVMITGYNRYDGAYLPRTRIGSSTHLGATEHLNIEDNVFIGHYNFIEASNGLAIGQGCQITNFVSILTHSSHISIRLYGDAYFSKKNPIGYVKGGVSIGNFTFIGPHSVIMPGTKIGQGCIVSAFSLVKGEFPDFAIIQGNPATIVGDTRELDRHYLEQHPELSDSYMSCRDFTK